MFFLNMRGSLSIFLILKCSDLRNIFCVTWYMSKFHYMKKDRYNFSQTWPIDAFHDRINDTFHWWQFGVNNSRVSTTLFSYRGPNIQDCMLFLQRPIFSHKQHCMVVLRVKMIKGLKVLCCDKDDECTNSTSNIVYKEILFRIWINTIYFICSHTVHCNFYVYYINTFFLSSIFVFKIFSFIPYLCA